MMNMIKPKILLVEDDPNLSMVLQDYLEMMDYDITLVQNGKEGLRFSPRKFDLCILDIMMPVMDGFTMAEEIKKIKIHSHHISYCKIDERRSHQRISTRMR